jgi:hypothetical protein
MLDPRLNIQVSTPNCPEHSWYTINTCDACIEYFAAEVDEWKAAE